MPTSFTVSLPGGNRAFTVLLAAPAVIILSASAVLTSLAGADTTSLAGRAATYFSADGEANLWSWYTGLLLSFNGIGLVLLAMSEEGVAARRSYWAFAAVAFYLSADEIASLHELLFQPAAALGLGGAGWLALGIPVVLLAGMFLLVGARAIDRTLRVRLVMAGAVFLVGAVGFEALNEFALESLDLSSWSPVYLLETTVEEGLEFSGTLLALIAMLHAVQRSAAGRRPSLPGAAADRARKTIQVVGRGAVGGL